MQRPWFVLHRKHTPISVFVTCLKRSPYEISYVIFKYVHIFIHTLFPYHIEIYMVFPYRKRSLDINKYRTIYPESSWSLPQSPERLCTVLCNFQSLYIGKQENNTSYMLLGLQVCWLVVPELLEVVLNMNVHNLGAFREIWPTLCTLNSTVNW